MPTTINATPTASRPEAAKRLAGRPPIVTKVNAESAPAPSIAKPVKLKRGQLGATKKGLLNLPATGGYAGGNETGKAMALNLLKEMRASEPGLGFLRMQHMISEFMKRIELDGGLAAFDRPVDEWSEAQTSRRGQYVGFIGTLSHWMEAAAQQMGSELDGMSENMLLTMASDGLNLDMDEWLKRDEEAGAA
jgi:hypothetical protein